MSEVRFGIIGCGEISRIHYQALAEIKRAKLIAVADINKVIAEARGKEFGVESYSDYFKLLDRKDIDAVCVCTPSGTHKDIVIQAALKGKHLLVEKPLEIDTHRIDEMEQICRKNNVLLGTVLMYRYKRDSKKVFDLIQTGKLGKMILGDAYIKWYRTDEYYSKSNWKGTWKLDGGGALMNQSIHSIDLLQWFMGPVESIFAYSGALLHKEIEVEDTAVAVLRFKSGAVGVIEGATSVYPGYKTKIELTGENGTVIFEDGEVKSWDLKCPIEEPHKKLESYGGTGGAKAPMDIGYHNHRDLIEDFVFSIIEKKPFWIDAKESRKSVEIILDIYKSARTGKPVIYEDGQK